ncbi:MAG: hypothetical protein ACTSRZ_14175 [Promethearchaeota archaeon]
MVRPGLFGINCDNCDLDAIVEEGEKNTFLECVKRVISELKLSRNHSYANVWEEIIEKEMQEIEIELDKFLIDLNVPYGVNHFLLLLFKELYDTYMEFDKFLDYGEPDNGVFFAK